MRQRVTPNGNVLGHCNAFPPVGNRMHGYMEQQLIQTYLFKDKDSTECKDLLRGFFFYNRQPHKLRKWSKTNFHNPLNLPHTHYLFDLFVLSSH